VGVLNQGVHEAGRAVEPLEAPLVEQLTTAERLHADETSWREHGEALWLGVFLSATTVLFLIGYRRREVVEAALMKTFAGWLMTDGYIGYRHYAKRLRCWAHLLRQGRGLTESLNRRSQSFGREVVVLLQELMKAIYQAREGPPGTSLRPDYANRLEEFKALCQAHTDSAHEKTRALAVEFLNDWKAIWVVLDDPWLPVTNNEAEQALRHWVIARKISSGTRTEQGSRAFALLASVIETCRRRNASPWP
jgi:hypothetical protein